MSAMLSGEPRVAEDLLLQSEATGDGDELGCGQWHAGDERTAGASSSSRLRLAALALVAGAAGAAAAALLSDRRPALRRSGSGAGVPAAVSLSLAEDLSEVIYPADCEVGTPGVVYSSPPFTARAGWIDSITDCAQHCEATAECTSWTFVTSYKECFFRGGNVNVSKKLWMVDACSEVVEQGRRTGAPIYTFNYATLHRDNLFACHPQPAAALWQRAASNQPLQTTVLSYNLMWWNVFDHAHSGIVHWYKRNTTGNMATNLIQKLAGSGYELMGFQECEDIAWILLSTGLSADFEAVQGLDGRCMAFKKSLWTMLANGNDYVAEDNTNLWWGARGVQWLRLQSKTTGATVLFANHHGPLPISTGGPCGGEATANNILSVISANGKPGDTVVLVGDFNALADSPTIKILDGHLPRVYDGLADGGIDHIFTNARLLAKENLGGGGSDHDALGVTLEL